MSLDKFSEIEFDNITLFNMTTSYFSLENALAFEVTKSSDFVSFTNVLYDSSEYNFIVLYGFSDVPLPLKTAYFENITF